MDEPKNDSKPASTRLSVQTLFGMYAKRALIEIQVGSGRIQLNIPEARAFAVSILDAVGAAATEDVLMSLLINRIGLNGENAARVLRDMREERDKLDIDRVIEKPGTN